MSKKKQKKKSIQYKDLAISALIDLIVGFLLILIDRLLGQQKGEGNFPSPKKNITQIHCLVKNAWKIRYFSNCSRQCKIAYCIAWLLETEKGVNMNIGENIKQARLKTNMTQKEFAEKLEVYPKDVCRWEKGERTPSLERFVDICRILNVSSDELLELNK